MRQIALVVGLVAALAAAPAAAQTRVSVAVGFGIPRPYVSGVVVVVVPRRYPVRPLFVDRVVVSRAWGHRHRHRYYRHDYEHDDE